MLNPFKKMSSPHLYIGEVFYLIAFSFLIRALYWVYSFLYNLKSLNSFNSSAFRLIDFRPRIILSVGTPNHKGNNYCITIKVKTKVSSNSGRNISRAPRLYGKYSYSG